ncbi:uncharacterized protein LOC116771589 [Danaus plexippus]|uniref:uncharacterized protein LOC116771589 n=1 Tax=Danaus plexippus TaxID=13037 RepID=UPI002AB06CA2|nr:uncharacterized protein LOC116771589 [Danaus plexippus]
MEGCVESSSGRAGPGSARGGLFQSGGSGRRGRYRMVNTSCAVFQCDSTSFRHRGVRFHQFPRDERALVWLAACRRPELQGKDVDQLKNLHICSLHFEEWMYGKQLLKKTAVPTLNLPSSETSDRGTQTEVSAPVTLHVATSQGVQTDDELIMALTRAAMMRELAKIPSVGQARKRFFRVYGTDRRARLKIGVNSSISVGQFLQSCDAFLPDAVSAFVKAHVV